MAWIDAVDTERACCSWVVSDGGQVHWCVYQPIVGDQMG